MAEKYLDQSGVSRLLQGVNTFVNNAYKNVFTKMIEVDSYETVNLQPNQIIKITPVVDGPMTINFIAHTKPNAEYELIVDVTPNATITYNGNVLWENGEFVPNNFNTVRLRFTTFDSGSTYLAEYTLYLLDGKVLYYNTTDDSEMTLTGLEYIPGNISETQIGDEIYTRALLLKGSNITLDSQFKNNEVLKSIVLPKIITTISNNAFQYCDSLTSVTIPDSVTTIGNYAFDGCSSLTSITIPDGVTTIGRGAFADCSSLKEFKGKFAADNGRCLIKDNTIIAYAEASGTIYTIPDSVTSIGYAAFYECSSLTSVTIPDSVTLIDQYAFKGSGLTSINIPNNVTNIRQYAFYDCTKLTNVTIGNGVTTIGYQAFEGCWRIISVTMGNSVTSIGQSAFKYCSGLTSINIPNSVINIERSAFYDCRGLTSVTIGNSVTSIEDHAFYNCSSLPSVTIPDSVTTIGHSAFRKCTKLTNVILSKNMTDIDSYTFANCTSLTHISIPTNITGIWQGSFEGCSKLSSIVSYSNTAPVIFSDSFKGIARNGTLWCFINSDYSTWMSTNDYYLGSSGWTNNYFEPTNCYNLSITADNVMWNNTTAPVQWSCLVDAIDPVTNETVVGIVLKGTEASEPFAQNTSDLDIERTIVFEKFGLSETTTITQYRYGSYTINLNNQWQKSTNIANPDSSVYDGVYESFSNYHVDNTGAIMTITISGYSNFILYIRSYAESSYDYVMVSQLDQTITNSSSYSNPTLVKAHTRGNPQSGTAISNYTKVEFENIDGGEHTITIVYRKDSSANTYDDRGYVLIPKS